MTTRFRILSAPFWIAAGLVIAIGSDAAAQQRMGDGNPTNTSQAAGGGGQTTGGGGGALGGSTDPSAAVTGELSRSEDRMLSDVGGGATGTGQLGGLGGLGGAGGFRGMGGFGGLSPFGTNPFGGGANAADSKPTVRTRLRIESRPPAVSGPAASGRLSRQLADTPVRQMVDGLSVSIADGVATLSGTANNEKDRRMAELVLRLEPGVRQIENQIVVAE